MAILYLDAVIEEALRYARTAQQPSAPPLKMLGSSATSSQKPRGLLAQPRPQHLQPAFYPDPTEPIASLAASTVSAIPGTEKAGLKMLGPWLSK